MALIMKYLIDTNIWLELLLKQEKAEEVSTFLDKIATEEIAISDFALYSIGVILCRLSKPEAYCEFLTDLFDPDGVALVGLNPKDLVELPDIVLNIKLDFDDAHQYLVSKNYNLTIITFDNDFKRAGIYCKRPSEV